MPLGQVICKRYEPICVSLKATLALAKSLPETGVRLRHSQTEEDVGTCRSFAVAIETPLPRLSKIAAPLEESEACRPSNPSISSRLKSSHSIPLENSGFFSAPLDCQITNLETVDIASV